VVQGRRPRQANTLPPKSHSKKLERRQDRRQPWAKRSVRSPRSKPNRSKVTQGPSTTTRSAWTPRRACLARKWSAVKASNSLFDKLNQDLV
jgi:hypothetical protein